MRRAAWIVPALALALSACATGGTGENFDGTGRRDGTADGVVSEGGGDGGGDTGAGDGTSGDASDGAVGRACRSDDECTAPDLCTNAQRCVFGHCQVMGGRATCDDMLACTEDSCDATRGACVHTPRDSMCPSGRFCDPANGCVAMLPCELGDTTCNRLNTDPCTGTWSCDAARLVCVRSAPPDCADTDPCTSDMCMSSGAMYTCGHMPMFDYMSNVANCGGCMMACPMRANATPMCMTGNCQYACQAMYADLDGDLNAARTATSNGCECHATETVDTPDLAFQDTNCDGIDGTITRAVFVSPRGDDTNDGSMAHPLRTLSVAVSRAGAAIPPKDVYAALGMYTGSITLTGGVSIYGGYDDTRMWSRAMTNVSTIQGDSTTAVYGNGLAAPVELQLLTIRAQDATTAGTSSYGVRVVNSGNVTVRGCSVYAGNGAAGGAGRDGATGTAGGNGGNGSSSGTAAGGSSSCGARGGAGGASVSGNTGGQSGQPGVGLPGGGRGGSAGTGGAQSGLCGGRNAGSAVDNAGPGERGSNGVNGTTAAALVSLSGGLYVGGPAPSGTVGTPGGGGGGGASGGGDTSFVSIFDPCHDFSSGGGGGGGGGGCAGGLGTGGNGGGGSFAILSVSTMLTVDRSRLFTSSGGNGGRGGNGGEGGANGVGGPQGNPSGGHAGTGAPGADGGQGGAAGSGSGGAGGPSICVYYTGTSPSASMNTCSHGSAGNGGTGGSNTTLGRAPDGPAGVADDTRAGM